MNLKILSKTDFLHLVFECKGEFLERIKEAEIFIVKGFYDSEKIVGFRKKVFDLGLSTDPSWHPLYDDCSDYHRLHDNYPAAYVKAKMHAFYFHTWQRQNKRFFTKFEEIFFIKNFLGGFAKKSFLSNIPSDGYVSRINVHNYPIGGGYQAEHVDQTGLQALIQTIIQASNYKSDFTAGGVYVRKDLDSPKIFLDEYTIPGDLIVFSPNLPHGVEPIDPEMDYNWKINKGRWVILPVIISSDYPHFKAAKPRQLSKL